MATAIAIMGGGDVRKPQPIIEADNSWRDKLAAKAFILKRAHNDAFAYGADWVQIVDDNGWPMTARQKVLQPNKKN